MSNGPDHLFMALFPIFFLGMWLLVTTVSGFMPGWFDLQQHYPRGDEPALLKLRFAAGTATGHGANGASRRSNMARPVAPRANRQPRV